MTLQIKSVEIVDTFGITHQRFSPKSVTIIRGSNGTGKSSVIRSIAKVFEGGKTPEIIRKGAKKSVITLVLSNNTIITKTTTPKSSTLEIVGPDGEPIGAPATYVAQLSEILAVDPARILKIDAGSAAGRKELVSLLLELMPISFSEEEVNAALFQWTKEPFKADGRLDLGAIDKLRESLTEKRRRVGVQARDAEGTVESLRKALPEQDEKDWGEEVKRLDLEVGKISKMEATEKLTVSTEAKDERTRRNQASAKEEQKLREDFQQAMDALNAGRAIADRAIDKAEREAIDEIREKYAPEYSALTTAIAQAGERHQAQLKSAGLRESIESWSRKCSESNGLHQRLTFAIEELDKLKKTKLDSLPIQGLEFSDDRVMIDGVEWQNCNTARRVEIAMQLSALRAGDLSLLLLDDAEHLDTETRRLLEQGIADSGFQLIEALVQDCPLRIETVNAAVTA